MLFARSITNWADWGAVFQSIPVFLPLAREIFAREGLPPIRDTAPLTPGTNAVFRADQFVVKIFAPAESGLDAESDFRTEQAAIRRAEALGIATPKLRGSGYIQDRYRFYYLITDYIPGIEAGEWLKTADVHQKEQFCGWLRDTLSCWNTPCEDGACFRRDMLGYSLTNPRWKAISPAAEMERHSLVGRAAHLPEVCVHGDLTAENLLVSNTGHSVLIDFADTVVAPACYELPPICFSLFDYDPQLARSFWKCSQPLVEALFDGLLLHDFGANFIVEICERFLHIPPLELSSLEPIREFLRERYGTENR